MPGEKPPDRLDDHEDEGYRGCESRPHVIRLLTQVSGIRYQVSGTSTGDEAKRREASEAKSHAENERKNTNRAKPFRGIRPQMRGGARRGDEA